MKAGTLRHLVSLQSATKTEGDYGEDTETWTQYAAPRAAIVPLRGAEFYAAQQVNAEINVKIIIRYRADVKASHRVVFGSITYEIAAPPINPQMKNIELHLMCKIIN
ncbi:MAG: phage head closure protein [Gammaproteobacteria bacterium]|nr:phage head closure protein [Gammaproteobacteria bacterium]